MGAGQIGGLATLLDIDFHNIQGFIGTQANNAEANYVFYYLSSAMLFCTGSLIETHIAVSAAPCVYGEVNKFQIVAGTHRFAGSHGVTRVVNNFCLHYTYNASDRHGLRCGIYNIAILLLETPFQMMTLEPGAEYTISRIRYGNPPERDRDGKVVGCVYYGWGSRRSGMLLPLLLNLRRVEVVLIKDEFCDKLWNVGDQYLCISMPSCKSEKYGALCPDDLGSVIDCDGWLQGVMVSRLVDRPCGVGWADSNKEFKFLTCATDDGRDVDIGRELTVQTGIIEESEESTTHRTTRPPFIHPPFQMVEGKGQHKQDNHNEPVQVSQSADVVKGDDKVDDIKIELDININEPLESPPGSPAESRPESPAEPQDVKVELNVDVPLESPPESLAESPPESLAESPAESPREEQDKTKKRTNEELSESGVHKKRKKKRKNIYL